AGRAANAPAGTVTQPLASRQAEPAETLAIRVADAARAHQEDRIILGLPLRLDGARGPEAAAAQRLAAAIRHESGLPVEMVDERLTTAAADRALIAGGVKREQRRQGIDRVAATMLLQGHLDQRRRQKPG